MRRHRRRSLMAMPFSPPQPPNLASSTTSNELGSVTGDIVSPPRQSSHETPAGPPSVASAKTVESFIAAVWMPDSKAEKCMRCHEAFTVFKRRHHCRLCGLVCCHWCSTKVGLAFLSSASFLRPLSAYAPLPSPTGSVQTFIINDSSRPTTASTPVRACDPCYDALFSPHSPTTPTSGSLNRTTSTNTHSNTNDRPPSLTRSSHHSDSSTPSTPGTDSHPLPNDPSPTTSRPDRTSGLATLRISSHSYSNSADLPHLPSEGGVTNSHPHPSGRAQRRLSGVNDRFSVFVGGGQGGADWGGRGEVSSSGHHGHGHGDRDREGGDGGDESKGGKYGAVAGRLRSVLVREEAARGSQTG